MVASPPALLPSRSTSPPRGGPSRGLRGVLPGSPSADSLKGRILSSLLLRGRGPLHCGGRILVAAALLLLLWAVWVSNSQPGILRPRAAPSRAERPAGADVNGSSRLEDVGLAVQASAGSGGVDHRSGRSISGVLELHEEPVGVFKQQADESRAELASLAHAGDAQHPRHVLSAVVTGAMHLDDQVLLLLQLPQKCGGGQDQGSCPGVLEAVLSAQCQFGCQREEETSEVLGASLSEHGRLFVRCRTPQGWRQDTAILASLVLAAGQGAGSLGGASATGAGSRGANDTVSRSGGEDGPGAEGRQLLQVNCSDAELPAACSCVSPFLPTRFGLRGHRGEGSSIKGEYEAHCPSSAERVLNALQQELRPASAGVRLASCARLVAQPRNTPPQLVVDAVLQRRGLYVFVKGLTKGVPRRIARKRAQGMIKGLGSFFGGLLGANGSSPHGGSMGQEEGEEKEKEVLNVMCEFGRNCPVPAISGALEVILCPIPPAECLAQGQVSGMPSGTAGAGAGTGSGEEGALASLGLGGQPRIAVSIRDGGGNLFPSLAVLPERPTFPMAWGTGEGELNHIPDQGPENQGAQGSPGSPAELARGEDGAQGAEGAQEPRGEEGAPGDLARWAPKGVSNDDWALAGSDGPRKEFYVCSCTMVYNMAKFLREWLVYHHWMGVQRFFLYDNLSSDNLTEAARSFSAWAAAHPDFFPKAPAGTAEGGLGRASRDTSQSGGERVTVHPWPWLKSQQSGFSHCLLRAAPQCTWVLFTDVDEFLRPKLIEKLDTREAVADLVAAEGPMLHRLMAAVRDKAAGALQRRSEKLGEICFQCLEFGASGHEEHPREGVSAGYTCRRTRPQRHKCLVRPEAVDDSLFTRIHHFDMRPGFQSNLALAHGKERLGWINHYKYQAWKEFRNKFVRRVATTVKDWDVSSQMSKKEFGRDMDSALEGADAEHMPKNWPTRFCDVNDTAVSQFVHLVFAANTSALRVGDAEQQLLW